MKEPWEVFLESFRHGIGAVDLAQPWDELREKGEEFLAGASKAQESLIYHLAETQGWSPREAKALAWEFVQTTVEWMKRKEGDESLTLGVALKNQWTDWVLRKGAK